MVYLKPCPFCGSKAEVRFSGSYYNMSNVKGYIIVGCTVCRASVRGMFYQGEPIEDYPLDETVGAQRAIANWNTRQYGGVRND